MQRTLASPPERGDSVKRTMLVLAISLALLCAMTTETAMAGGRPLFRLWQTSVVDGDPDNPNRAYTPPTNEGLEQPRPAVGSNLEAGISFSLDSRWNAWTARLAHSLWRLLGRHP